MIKAVIRENIDQPWETLFLSFDERPLGRRVAFPGPSGGIA